MHIHLKPKLHTTQIIYFSIAIEVDLHIKYGHYPPTNVAMDVHLTLVISGLNF